MTHEGFKRAIRENHELWDIQEDNEGQLVVYTGLYVTRDGGISEKPDQDFDKDY